MTNERKIEILKQARELITYRNVVGAELGICWAIIKQLTREERDEHYPYDNLYFYGIRKPKKVYDSFGYYPFTQQGVTDRLNAIDKAIEKLEKEIK